MENETGGYTIIPKPDSVLDCSGLLEPLPVIKASEAIKQIKIGQVLQLISTDPSAPREMEAWANLTGNELLDSRQEADKFVFHFRRVK